VIENFDRIKRAIARRTDADSLYLCGPFDSEGRPASADVHILALSHGGEVRDLHFLSEATGLERSVEVSVVPVSLIETSVHEGVADGVAFYTLDKMIRGKALIENPGVKGLRRSLAQGIRLKPSFYARTMGNLRGAWLEARRAAGLMEKGLRCNLALLLALCLYSLLYLRRPFSRNSGLVTQTGKVWRRGDADREQAETAIGAGKRFVEAVLKQNGVNPDALAEDYLCYPREEESR